MNDAAKKIAVIPMNTKVAEYSATAAGLADLQSRLKDVVYDVTKAADMQIAVKDRRECIDLRTNLEKLRVKIKEPALEACRLIDSEAKTLKEAISILEEPIDAQIKAEEGRKAREKAERDALEAARVAKINEHISRFQMSVSVAAGKSSAEITRHLKAVEEDDVSKWADEFLPLAAEAHMKAVAALEQLHAGAVAQEEASTREAVRVAAEREELAQLRAAQDKRETEERARMAMETKRQLEEQAAARAKIEADEQASRERIEAQEREAAAKRKAQDAEREHIAKQQAHAQEQEFAEKRRVQEAEDQRLRHVQEQLNKVSDARTMLTTFVERFGEMKEFKLIAKQITVFLAGGKNETVR